MVTKKDLEEYFVDFFVETFGTFILIVFNEGAIANYKFAQLTTHSVITIYIAIGVGIYTALMAGGSITGAHINPAVSISFMTVGKLKPLKCLFYVIGQIFGAFLGATLVYLVYWSQFNRFDGGFRQIIGINGTDQIVGTALLLIFIMAVDQHFNQLVSVGNKAFALIFIVIGINCAFSINAAAALNPARDFGPRLLGAFIYGWINVFTVNNHYFWIPIVGPLIGGILGSWIFKFYAFIVEKYGHVKNMKEKNLNEINVDDTNRRRIDEEICELRQQLTVEAY
ncbi:unnamed protein product [Adineta ricciae]|uniref:Uncharacterized protein n=1 Tax=Adineta ricciae TaxID=249248 RepID=A0A815S339_ADIRI|nr:unnamed protein product [Adineta ricciae]